MGTRSYIYQFMATQEGAVWASEIAAGVKALGGKWKSGTQNELVREGIMAVVTNPGQPDAYVIVRKPSKWKHSPEEAAAARKAKYAKRNAQQAAERRARGAKAIQRRPKLHVVPASPAGLTSEDFVAAGGTIEVLPGFQRDGVYARRRPIMHTYRSGSV